ncbi:hypothetical protein ES332_A05G364200v1 [Gossypium tomentosum]|uniref:Uncharacterized protein n=1 Tax=Gossypium tomentosum TaxID=34277 RepID=A0A5D2QPW4_GOSTO|nr:hypothetical protein ES332_A05G364200v1 [Gossypium tomentosum]
MDESEKRKERLKAMRMEAANAEVSENVQSSAMPGSLSNPLIETSSSLTAQDDFCRAPRFDYYTDPMAAFSGNKKRDYVHNPAPSDPGPRNTGRGLPVHQMQSHFAPDRGVYKQGPYSPRLRSPSLMHQGQSDAWNGPQATEHYNFVSDGSPRGMFGGPPQHPGTFHRVWNPSNTSSYGKLPNPGFSPADGRSFNYGAARPQMFGRNPILDQRPGSSPSFSPGRGRGPGYRGSSGPGLGRSAGRGQGFHGRSSASNKMLGPECYFDESMLKDPWQHLKPIPWRRQEAGMDSLGAPGTSNSSGIKRAKVSEASSKQSLAEYLAASFNKAVEGTE